MSGRANIGFLLVLVLVDAILSLFGAVECYGHW